MKAALIKIGNSQGIRIPKAIIEHCGFEKDVEFEIHKKTLVVRSSKKPRQDWETAFKMMVENGDDKLMDSEIRSSWDEAEWEWK
jgi:antitoxin MazE